jgi:hypothetical protein
VRVPGRVQSRINVASDGWEHLVKRHFNAKVNASQFTVSEKELKSLLQSEQVVGSPVVGILRDGDNVTFVREVDMGRPIGVDKYDDWRATNVMTVVTDRYGNLQSATPGRIDQVEKF